MRLLTSIPVLLLAIGCHSSGSHAPRTSMSAAKAAATFEKIKALEGDWKGKGDVGGKTMDVSTTFAVTAAGTAVVESLFKGTPHEMVTVYHMDGDRLRLTHYCAAGNQPTMVADATDRPDTVEFDFDGASNLASIKHMHMHDARIHFIDGDTIEAWWNAWNEGKHDHTAHIKLTRVSAR